MRQRWRGMHRQRSVPRPSIPIIGLSDAALDPSSTSSHQGRRTGRSMPVSSLASSRRAVIRRAPDPDEQRHRRVASRAARCARNAGRTTPSPAVHASPFGPVALERRPNGYGGASGRVRAGTPSARPRSSRRARRARRASYGLRGRRQRRRLQFGRTARRNA
jgi:hypothetical protein